MIPLLKSALGGALVGFFIGASFTADRLTTHYATERAKAQELYSTKIREATTIATDITKQYLEEQDRADQLYADNQRLIHSMQQPNACHCPTASNTAAPAHATTTPPLSREVANNLARLAKEADSAAIYAQQCHRWVLELQKKKASK